MIQVLLVIYTLSLVYMLSAGRLETFIQMLSLQGVLLFLVAYLELTEVHISNLAFILIETLLFKGIAVPLYLNYVIGKNQMTYEREPDSVNFYSMLKISMIVVGSFLLASQLKNSGIRVMDFTASMSAILTGVLIVTRRKKIITHVIGYLVLDNGIFLLSLSIGNHMPFIINISILFDILIEVILLGVFIGKVSTILHETEADKIADIKD